MKNDELMDLVGKVDDKYIAELYNDMDAAAVSPPRKSGGWQKWAALAACLVLVIAGGAIFLSRPDSAVPDVTVSPMATPPAPMSVVIMDVNPSIQFMLGPDGVVDTVTALNNDAAALLGGRNYKGDGCAEAMKEIVTALEEKGYLSNIKNSVLLTVVGEDNETSEAVCERVTAAMEYAAGSGFDISILSQVADVNTYAQYAEKYGISVGKAALVKKIVGSVDNYDYSELASLSIHSLDQILDYIGSDAVKRTGEVAGALTNQVSNDLGISNLNAEEAIDLAVALSNAYGQICRANPRIDAETYTGYDFHLERSTASDGSSIWTITANSRTDSSLPSVSVQLGKSLDIISDISEHGKSALSDPARLTCDILGLPKILSGS